MMDLPGIVFPHVYLSEKDAKRILSFFGPINLFRPWFMEQVPFFSEGRGEIPVKVLRPPEDLRPEKDFKVRLSEYKNWITHNQDRSFKDFFRATQGIRDSEDKVWDIRGSLRKMGQPEVIPEETPSLKWHLVLHLAEEMEREEAQAEALLGALKEKSSPLKGAVEEQDQARGLFDDLPRFRSDRIMDDFVLGQILEAWFGLFRGYLKAQDLLITPDRQVLDYVTGLWEEVCGQDLDTPMPTVEFKFPDLSNYPLDDLFRIKERDCDSEKIRELKEGLSNLGKDSADRSSALDALAKEAEKTCLTVPGGKAALIRVTGPLPPGGLATSGALKDLFGRTIVLVEETS